MRLSLIYESDKSALVSLLRRGGIDISHPAIHKLLALRGHNTPEYDDDQRNTELKQLRAGQRLAAWQYEPPSDEFASQVHNTPYSVNDQYLVYKPENSDVANLIRQTPVGTPASHALHGLAFGYGADKTAKFTHAAAYRRLLTNWLKSLGVVSQYTIDYDRHNVYVQVDDPQRVVNQLAGHGVRASITGDGSVAVPRPHRDQLIRMRPFQEQANRERLLTELSYDYADWALQIKPRQFEGLFHGKLRIAIPFTAIPPEILDVLRAHNISVDGGMAVKTIQTQRGPKQVRERIGKVIGKLAPSLLSKWSGEDYAIIISRAPIDILRMADFAGLESCHSPNSSQFSSCAQEAKYGGLVAYLVRRSQLAGVDLDSPEIFRDSERGIDGLVPMARLRLRRITKGKTELAVPERRIYGNAVPGFYGAIMQWARQQDLPDLSDLSGYRLRGGEYQDTPMGHMVGWLTQRKEVPAGEVEHGGTDNEAVQMALAERCVSMDGPGILTKYLNSDQFDSDDFDDLYVLRLDDTCDWLLQYSSRDQPGYERHGPYTAVWDGANKWFVTAYPDGELTAIAQCGGWKGGRWSTDGWSLVRVPATYAAEENDEEFENFAGWDGDTD